MNWRGEKKKRFPIFCKKKRKRARATYNSKAPGVFPS